MSEYLLAVKYKNMGCGISILIAGIEDGEYSRLGISLDGENFIEVSRSGTNLDFSTCVNFDGLKEFYGYDVFGQVVYTNGVVKNLNIKTVSQITTATVELSPEMKRQKYKGGVSKGRVDPLKEVNI